MFIEQSNLIEVVFDKFIEQSNLIEVVFDELNNFILVWIHNR